MKHFANASARGSTHTVAGLRRTLEHFAAANPGTDGNIRLGYEPEDQLRGTKKEYPTFARHLAPPIEDEAASHKRGMVGRTTSA
jgi:hypothetical protein